MELRLQWLEAKGNSLSRLAELVETTDGAVYADPDTECRGVGAEAMLAQKQVTSRIHERAYRNRPLRDHQKESNRPEVQDSRAHRTRLRLHEPVHEKILPAAHWAAAQCGGDWLDQLA